VKKVGIVTFHTALNYGAIMQISKVDIPNAAIHMCAVRMYCCVSIA